MTDLSPWSAPPSPRWMDASGPPGTQARARATRRAIVAAASVVIDEHGYHGTSLQEIIHECGLTKGALYFHFPSKSALAEALLVEVFASWQDLIERIEAVELDPLQTLITCYDAYTGRLMYDASARAALRIVQDEIGHRHAVAWSQRWQKTVEDLLVAAADRGLLQEGIDAAWLSRFLLAVATGHFQLAEDQPSGPDMRERMNDSWAGLLPAIATAPWVSSWRNSGWATRPAPGHEDYEFRRRRS